MDILDIFFSLLFFIPYTYALQECTNFECPNTAVPIRFPFWVGPQLPGNCGFPGFNLTCDSHGAAVLKLPFSGEFFVRGINYVTQEVQLYDPKNCLPQKYLSFNLAGSPFVAAMYHNYIFLSCPASFTNSRFTPIGCLSNSTTSVLATPSTSLAKSMSATCQIIATLAVPVSGQVQTGDGFLTNLESDLSLTWHEPACSSCESEGGNCGFKNETSQELVCNHDSTADSTAGGSNKGSQALMIICVSLTVAISCAIGLACFACIRDSVAGTGPQRSTRAVAAEPPLQEPTSVTVGLDQTTIESYQMLVLGESRRMPGPNNTTCAICLSEYLTEETVRCIPECKHCFHAECIDEWLRLNSTCPVCRNNPSPAHVNSDNV